MVFHRDHNYKVAVDFYGWMSSLAQYYAIDKIPNKERSKEQKLEHRNLIPYARMVDTVKMFITGTKFDSLEEIYSGEGEARGYAWYYRTIPADVMDKIKAIPLYQPRVIGFTIPRFYDHIAFYDFEDFIEYRGVDRYFKYDKNDNYKELERHDIRHALQHAKEPILLMELCRLK